MTYPWQPRNQCWEVNDLHLHWYVNRALEPLGITAVFQQVGNQVGNLEPNGTKKWCKSPWLLVMSLNSDLIFFWPNHLHYITISQQQNRSDSKASSVGQGRFVITYYNNYLYYIYIRCTYCNILQPKISSKAMFFLKVTSITSMIHIQRPQAEKRGPQGAGVRRKR